MRDILIMFVILLVILMLISAFGGSIRQRDFFFQGETPALQPNIINTNIANPNTFPEFDSAAASVAANSTIPIPPTIAPMSQSGSATGGAANSAPPRTQPPVIENLTMSSMIQSASDGMSALSESQLVSSLMKQSEKFENAPIQAWEDDNTFAPVR